MSTILVEKIEFEKLHQGGSTSKDVTVQYHSLDEYEYEYLEYSLATDLKKYSPESSEYADS